MAELYKLIKVAYNGEIKHIKIDSTSTTTLEIIQKCDFVFNISNENYGISLYDDENIQLSDEAINFILNTSPPIVEKKFIIRLQPLEGRFKTVGTQTQTDGVSSGPCEDWGRTESKLDVNTVKEDLKSFLSDCGQNILNEYSSTGALVDRSRKSLMQLIVERLTTTRGFYPSREEKVVWAKAAAAIFPNLCEGKNGENFKIFYDPENRGGYISYRLKTVNRIIGNTSRLTASEQKRANNGSNHNCPDEEEITWMQNATVSQTDEIFSRMKKTFCCRRGEVAILIDFPRFLDVPGLIQQDFELRFPGKGNNFIY